MSTIKNLTGDRKIYNYLTWSKIVCFIVSLASLSAMAQSIDIDKVLQSSYSCPAGYRILTKLEADPIKGLLSRKMPEWGVYKLDDGWVIGGWGHNGAIWKDDADYRFCYPMDLSFAVMGDSQAWRLVTGDPNSDENKAPWEHVNNMNVESLNKLYETLNLDFGIVNGDITEFGRKKTWSSFYNVYDKLKIPLYIGLGNHDYANNVNDCVEHPFGTSKNSCAYFSTYEIRKKAVNIYQYKLNNFNYDAGLNLEPVGQMGSLSYSWDNGVFHFVQLHNYPTYHVKLDDWAGNFGFDITKSLDWLKKDLEQAVQRNKYIIINFHDGTDHFKKETSDYEREFFKKIITDNKVMAIFVGHAHNAYQHTDSAFYGSTPVFVSDALFNNGYYVVQSDANGISIDSYKSDDGNPVPVKRMSYIKYPEYNDNTPYVYKITASYDCSFNQLFQAQVKDSNDRTVPGLDVWWDLRDLESTDNKKTTDGNGQAQRTIVSTIKAKDENQVKTRLAPYLKGVSGAYKVEFSKINLCH
ncbi:metallophosphoesterase [Enterobacter bugandensis]